MKRVKKHILQYVIILFAAIAYSVGISLFLDPNNLAPGGVTGVAIILNRLTGITTGTYIFLLNIPILCIGVWKLGWRLVASTLYATGLISVFTNLCSYLPPVTQDRLLAAIAGAVLVAVPVGVIFRCHATTGGIDIVVKLLRLKYRHMKTGVMFLVIDVVVVILAGGVFMDFEVAMYSGIAVALTSSVLDLVLYGRDGAMLIYVITDNPHIGGIIMKKMDIGVTYLHGKGAFTNKDKQIIMCVTRKQQGPLLEEIVKEADSTAFMIVTGANEIYGEGYKSYFAEKL